VNRAVLPSDPDSLFEAFYLKVHFLGCSRPSNFTFLFLWCEDKRPFRHSPPYSPHHIQERRSSGRDETKKFAWLPNALRTPPPKVPKTLSFSRPLLFFSRFVRTPDYLETWSFYTQPHPRKTSFFYLNLRFRFHAPFTPQQPIIHWAPMRCTECIFACLFSLYYPFPLPLLFDL